MSDDALIWTFVICGICIAARKQIFGFLFGENMTPPFTVKRGISYLSPVKVWLMLVRVVGLSADVVLNLAGFRLPYSIAQTGIMIAGTAGSGKSRLIVEYVESVLKRIRPGTGERMILFDPKNEFVSLIYSLAHPQIPIYLLNPFDQRATRWNVAADITDNATAQTLATTFLPDRPNDVNGFFTSNGRALIRDLIWAGIVCAPFRWTLRQIAGLIRNETVASVVLKQLPQTVTMGNKISGNDTGRDIVSTAFAALEPFAAATAAMDRSESTVSIREILDSECIVILGWDDAIAPALSSIYGLFLDLFINNALTNQDSNRRTFLIIDELRQLPKSCGMALNRAAFRGRSSAICPLVAFQDWNSLLEVYGQAGANELAGNFQTKVFLRQGSEEAAQWAASCLGKPEALWETTNRSFTENHHTDPKTKNINEHIGDRYIVHPSQLKALPLANRSKDSIKGFLITPVLSGTVSFSARFNAIAKRCKSHPDFPNYIRRPASDQVPEPFSAKDADLWNLPPSTDLLTAFAVNPSMPNLPNGKTLSINP